MSHPSGSDDNTSRRRSLFARSPLRALTPIRDSSKDRERSSTLRKKRTASSQGSISSPLAEHFGLGFDGESDPGASLIRPPALPRTGRPPSLFGSFRSIKSTDDYEEPSSTTSSKPPSINWAELEETSSRSRVVLYHGEVQTSVSMFRKKKEYLVLTESHLIRFKSQQKAAESFNGVPPPLGRSATTRHDSIPSGSSLNDFASIQSDSSGDRNFGTPLKHIVAIYRIDEGRPVFALEIACLDDETRHAFSMMFQFGNPEERDDWLSLIRGAANQACLAEEHPISSYYSHLAARVVERGRDYDPSNYAIYKVVQRPSSKSSGRSSSDDLSKVASTIRLLAIGINKVHVISISKSSQRPSSPSLAASSAVAAFGVLSISAIKVNEYDDTFDITFRIPLSRSKTLHLASLASYDIAIRLRQVEEFLRPEWESRPYTFSVPPALRNDSMAATGSPVMDDDAFDRTLAAYGLAYGFEPRNIRYEVTAPDEDFPCFTLLEPIGRLRHEYTTLELLAVMRSLRYNEFYRSVSFARITLDPLNGVHDHHGREHVCTKTKRGTAVKLTSDELGRSCLLVQEIRALAVTNKKLRKMDFTSCIKRQPHDNEENGAEKDIGCGIVEALIPLCRDETTNVDWIVLNGIHLAETDLAYLVAAAVDRRCHFRAIEVGSCKLTDRRLSLILDAFSAQEGTIEAIDISDNNIRMDPHTLQSQIGMFSLLRKLNLSKVPRTAGPEPSLSAETLRTWRLNELLLSGTSVNLETLKAIGQYLEHKQSQTLRTLKLDNTYLTGKDVALLLHSMVKDPGTTRLLHLDISQNQVCTHHEQFISAIATGHAPTQLTIKDIEYEDEAVFRKLILAVAQNNTITTLDISAASLPGDAKNETCEALEKVFTENKTLQQLDISGQESRLEFSKYGVGINRALRGLKYNNTLRVLRVEHQRLGLQGASTLADILKVNNTLRALYCEHNAIPLSGFTDIVNAVHGNTTLVDFSTMEASRQEALRQTETKVKALRDDTPASPTSRSSAVRNKIASKIAKTPIERPMPTLSDRDISAALDLVAENWNGQIKRMQNYLDRNKFIANGLPVPPELAEAIESLRGGSVSSIADIVQQVKLDTTPTLEKQLSFGPEAQQRESGEDMRAFEDVLASEGSDQGLDLLV